VRAVARLFRGNIDKSTIYHHFRAQSFEIESRQKELIVHFDGEPRVMPGKLQVKLHPKALKVAVGREVIVSS
jgi:diacylglycerol kinase family enzyme